MAAHTNEMAKDLVFLYNLFMESPSKAEIDPSPELEISTARNKCGIRGMSYLTVFLSMKTLEYVCLFDERFQEDEGGNWFPFSHRQAQKQA